MSTTKYIVNNLTGQTINGNQLERPYKVYTALLTQNGSTNPLYIDTGSLQIGVTYIIETDSPGMDFTNVGSPDNTVGTTFVANGTTPNSWGFNEGISNNTLRYDTGAPIVTLLENTLGEDIFWTYDSTGIFIGNSSGVFTENKTYLTITTNIDASAGSPVPYSRIISTNIYDINIETYYTNTNGGGVKTDGYLQNTPIEIRVYN